MIHLVIGRGSIEQSMAFLGEQAGRGVTTRDSEKLGNIPQQGHLIVTKQRIEMFQTEIEATKDQLSRMGNAHLAASGLLQDENIARRERVLDPRRNEGAKASFGEY